MLRNIGFSGITQILPLLAAVLLIPPLIAGLGEQRFGLLALAWVFLGYFSLFDLGVGRATTKFVAEYRARGRDGDIAPLVRTSWLMLVVLSVVGAVGLLWCGPLLVGAVPAGNGLSAGEAVNVMRLVALSVPFVMLTSGVRAVLEAYGRFGVIAAIGMPAGVLNYLLPYLLLRVTDRLDGLVAGLLVARVFVLFAYGWACLRVFPRGVEGGVAPLSALARMRLLLGYGGYITVSNLIGPLMTYLDRFLVSAMISLSAVTYYATPTEIVHRLRVFPASVMPVLFPAFTGMGVTDPHAAARLFRRSLRYLWLVSIPPMVALAAAAPEVLALWIDASFAQHSGPILRIMAVGSLLNFGAQVAFNWIQSRGRARVTALFHAIELPVFVVAAWGLVGPFGVTGMAWAWFLRIALDALLLFVYALRGMPAGERGFGYAVRLGLLALGYGGAIRLGITLSSGEGWWVVSTLAILATYPLAVYAGFITDDERAWLRKRMAARGGKP